MAKANGGKGFSLNNPVVIGSATAVIGYFLLEEVLDDYIEDFVDMLKGKRKKGKGKGKKVKFMSNEYGETIAVEDDDDY